MKKTIDRLKNYFGLKKRIEPNPECFIKVSRFECFCESPCNEYCSSEQKKLDYSYTANEVTESRCVQNR